MTQSIAFCKENCSASVTFLQHFAQTNSVFIRVETENEKVEKSIFSFSDVGAAKLVRNYFQPEIRSKKCLNSHPRKLLRYFISAGRKRSTQIAIFLDIFTKLGTFVIKRVKLTYVPTVSNGL